MLSSRTVKHNGKCDICQSGNRSIKWLACLITNEFEYKMLDGSPMTKGTWVMVCGSCFALYCTPYEAEKVT